MLLAVYGIYEYGDIYGLWMDASGMKRGGGDGG